MKSRIEYLSRAIVCVKSEEVGILDSHRNANGAELLHDLEEQMEVVRVQQSVVEAMTNMPRSPQVSRKKRGNKPRRYAIMQCGGNI